MTTPELQIQHFLRNGGHIEDLETRFSINCKRHKTLLNLCLFKYNQIASPFGEQIVREARGIILDEEDNWNVVSLAFMKFFNLGEPNASPIDWYSARVMEKLDGSLITLYPYRGSWHIATTGTPDGKTPINDFDITFSELFKSIYHYTLPPTDCGMCFFFELMSPYNRVVVEYKENKVVLLGARNLQTLEELTPREASLFLPGCPVVREFPFDNVDAVFAALKDMNGLEQEGFVVCDAMFRRVKIKAPSYITLHHAKDGFKSKRSIAEVVVKGEMPEVVSAFPEYKHLFDEIEAKLSSLIKEIEEDYAGIAHITLQKDFALIANKMTCPSALFALRAGKTKTVRQFLATIHIDNVMRLLKL